MDTGFQRPRYLEYDYETLTEKYGNFSAQPFERGYGVTIGNSLRRVLLSSITGAAITNVRIQGVLHEFSTLPGVVEDVTDIILNLKSIPLKLNSNETKKMYLKKQGPGLVTASDIEHDADIEILDKEVQIASLDKDGKLDIEMIVENKRGYISADMNYNKDLSVDFIPLDSSHSPVQRVNYKVEPARVGKRIDYEKLTIEVWTTGAISPNDALAQAAKILRDHLIIFLNVVDKAVEVEQAPTKKEIPYFSQIDILSKSIDHLELSVRSNNCLRSAGIEKIYKLVQKSEDELLKTKNFGRKSLTEIKETLQELGLSLNLDLHPKLIEKIEGEKKEEVHDQGEEE
ncbi:MAG: DNA-directed RNA polymerase subunit alpha [Candidatus Aminicenantes bacterium]|nr:DNA-directed RNA polymerase subunit alpha [Candidatus Aminicenantes bacterium]